MTFEEVKEMFKKSIDATDTMNQALENLIQSIYLKGYNDALEQEPILDKISSEIERPIIRNKYKYSQKQNGFYDGYEFACKIIADIINEYKAESEDME